MEASVVDFMRRLTNNCTGVISVDDQCCTTHDPAVVETQNGVQLACRSCMGVFATTKEMWKLRSDMPIFKVVFKRHDKFIVSIFNEQSKLICENMAGIYGQPLGAIANKIEDIVSTVLQGYMLSTRSQPNVGMTDAEQSCMGHLVAFWNAWCQLPADGSRVPHSEVQAAVHQLQGVMAIRVARRVNPSIWS